MSRLQSRTNAIVAALKSMVGGHLARNGAVRQGRNIRQNRSHRCAAQTEACETRVLLTLTVGPNFNISQLAGNQDESAIIVNPINPMQVFASSNNAAGGLFAARSIDGGATWLTSNGADSLIADGNDGLVAACCDPTLAWDTFGNLYISYLSADVQSIPIAISIDGGATFAQLTSFTGGSVDQPTITTGPGLGGAGQALWITYAQSGIQARGATVSGIGAANVGTFGAAQPVTGVNQFGDIAIGPTGQVVVTGQNDTQIQVNIDPDGLGPMGFSGVVIATTTNVNRFDAIPSQPLRTIDAEASLAYDRSGGVNNGRLYLLYTDEIVDENNDTDIFVRISNDNGATWGNRIRVNDDATTNSQWLGKLAIDQTTGNIGAVFYDARNSPTNTTVQLWGSISNDGGQTWDANTRISIGTIDGTVAATGGQQLGDYLGLIFDAGLMHPSWSDNSNSTFNNPNGTLRQLDIYSATILTGPAPLRLSITPSTISENADGLIPGSGGVMATIRRPVGSPNAQPLIVTLTSSDTTEIQVPATVTILAGQNAITFPVNVMDDNLLDGTQLVDLTADAVVGGSPVTGTASISVLDAESFNFTISATSVREDAGSGAVTVTVERSDIDTVAANVYVVTNDKLEVFDNGGTMLSTRPIPWPAGLRPAAEHAHDLIALQNGKIAVYNGTTVAYLSVFDPANATWQHFFIQGLSTDTDIATGGITSLDNSIFVTDTGTGGNPFGIVRFDLVTGVTTRFATLAPGYRLFVKSVTGTSITEVDPVSGATLNTIPMPVSAAVNYGFNNGLAFDGTDLWVLAGGIGNDAIYRIDANTGAVLQIHHLGGTDSWDGLAYLDGLLYAVRGSDQGITVYSPKLQRSIKTLNVGAANGINISGGLAGLAAQNRLVVTSAIGSPHEVFLINPDTGALESRFSTGLTATAYGLAVANGSIYLGEYNSQQLSVFTPAGVLLPSVTVAAPGGVFALGGDDLPGMRASSYRYRDVFAGFDNSIYALDVAGTVIGQYDPTSLNLVRFFNVANPVNGIAVEADGSIWGAGKDGNLYHFNSDGLAIETRITGAAELIDIDLNITGQLLLTSRDGSVIRMHTALMSQTTISVGMSEVFVTLGILQTLPAGDVVVQLTSSDISEISVQQFIVIPVGQQIVVVPLNAVDDNILDGTQSVLLTASSVGFLDVTQGIDVLDAETIGVDIIANQISEAAGINATQARVFRSNVDGPFLFSSRQTASNNTSQTILDYDTITSHITVPAQTSRLSDVNVTLSLTHQFLDDLDIYLIGPAHQDPSVDPQVEVKLIRTRVELVTDLNKNGNYLTKTTFDDAGLGSILESTPPFTGIFRPEGKLPDLNGENPSGTWTLEITDDNESDFGTLFSWSLDLETAGLAPQLVSLSLTGDPGEINLPQTVTIPANQAEILIPVNAVDDTVLDGPQIAGIQAGADAPGFELGNDSVEVLDQETFTFTVSANNVSEAAGIGALMGTLTRFNTDISSPFTVSVSSSDTLELTIGTQANPSMPANPMNVTIPANQTSVTFPINAVDDVNVDGPKSVMITVTIPVTAPGYGTNLTQTVIVEDLEQSLKLTTSTPVVAENSGSLTVTVSRLDQADLSAEMIVTVTVDPGLYFPAGLDKVTILTVTIPAGLDKVTFSVSIDDNAILSGTRNSNIHATGKLIATGSLITAGDLGITITDYETLTITVDKSSFLENAGVKAVIGTVRRSNTGNLAQALVVALASSDETELKVPATVTIPAGQASVTFFIDAVNDPNLDGTQNVTITATSAGYVNGTVGVAVLDHEPPVLSGPTATTPKSKPTITWNALSGALRYDVWITNLTTKVAQIVRNINVPTNSFVPPENLGIGRYRVWVRAIDNLEAPGFWSVGRDFFINTPATITSPSPSTIIAGSSFPTITWSAIPDAVKYEVWVNNLTTGQNRVINRSGTTALSTTSYVSTENLPSGTYKIWVRGLNSSKEAGLWSLPTTHTVLAPPVITQPVGGGTFDTTPTFGWTAVTGATSYDVYVADLKTNVVVLRNKFVTTNSFTATKDIPSGEYRMWVRAQSGNSFSAWSAPSTFSIGLPPKITSAKTVGTPAKPQFSWTTILGTERYELWVNNAANVRVIHQPNLTTTTFTSATTLSAGTYRVWVRAVSTMGEITDWSASVDLVIASSELPKDFVDSAHTTVLASLIFNDEPLTPDGSPVETVVASTTEADVPVNDNAMPETTVPAAIAIESIIPIEPAPALVSEYDAVMSEWQSADWWAGTSETQDRKESHSTAALAASLGLVVRQGQRSDDRRKRKLS